MEWIIDNWFVLIGVAALLIAAGWASVKFLGLPTKEQLKKIKEWMLYAVAEAEQQLGSGTGELKLRYVYDMFINQFPIAAKFITFDAFKILVDEALDKLKELLQENPAVAELLPSIKVEDAA